MREFDLVAIDWESVGLMQAEQFRQETYYLEELQRWALQQAGVFGILNATEKSISPPTPEPNGVYSVRVSGIAAVAPQGHILYLSAQPEEALRGFIEAKEAVTPLYLGVSLSESSREPLSPSSGRGLLNCHGRRRVYALAIYNTDTDYDWLQIAQYRKTASHASALERDDSYIPECMFLSSHPALTQAVAEIQDLARKAQGTLSQYSSKEVAVFSAAAALAGSLGAATRTLHYRQHPRAYIERLAGVFDAQFTQLSALPVEPSYYQDTINFLKDTLAYLDRDYWTLGEAFSRSYQCFEWLLQLYPLLLGDLKQLKPDI